MKHLTHVLGLVTAAGGFAAAGQASAVTVTEDIAVGSSQDITLAGAGSPQFYYNYTNPNFSKDYQNFGSYGSAGLSGANPTGSLGSQTYTSNEVETYYSKATPADQGVNTIDIMFTNAGTTYYGVANFDSNEQLTTISYSAAPEPEIWALLLAGAGAIGGAARTRRRAALAA